MITPNEATKLAMDYEEVVELPHFEKTSFRVNKKLFAVLDREKSLVAVKFTKEQQYAFCAYDKLAVYPVPGKWGLIGYTYMDLKRVKKNVFKDALRVSYCNVAPKKLAKKYQKEM